MEWAEGKEQTQRVLDMRDSGGVTLLPKGPVSAALFPQPAEGLALLSRMGGGGHTRHLLAGGSIPVQLSLPGRPLPPPGCQNPALV